MKEHSCGAYSVGGGHCVGQCEACLDEGRRGLACKVANTLSRSLKEGVSPHTAILALLINLGIEGENACPADEG